MINPQETQRPCGGKQNTETVYYVELEGRLSETEGEGEREEIDWEGRVSAYLKFTKKPGGEKQCVNHLTKQRAAVITLNTPCTNTQNKGTHNKCIAFTLFPIGYIEFIGNI